MTDMDGIVSVFLGSTALAIINSILGVYNYFPEWCSHEKGHRYGSRNWRWRFSEDDGATRVRARTEWIKPARDSETEPYCRRRPIQWCQRNFQGHAVLWQICFRTHSAVADRTVSDISDTGEGGSSSAMLHPRPLAGRMYRV